MLFYDDCLVVVLGAIEYVYHKQCTVNAENGKRQMDSKLSSYKQFFSLASVVNCRPLWCALWWEWETVARRKIKYH